MRRGFLPIALLAAVCPAVASPAVATEPRAGQPAAQGVARGPDQAKQPATEQPPKVRLRVRPSEDADSPKTFSLVVTVSNPNRTPVAFHGYRPETFEPPLKKGRIAPVCFVEWKRDGKWQREQYGTCGNGMDWIHLDSRASGTDTIPAPCDDWQVVRVGIRWSSSARRQQKKPSAIAWSNEVSRADAEKHKKKPVRRRKADAFD